MDRAEAIKFAEEMRDKLSYRLECAANVPARSYYEKQWGMLIHAIAALREREQSKWISVEDKLPERDEKCLCRYTFGEDGKMYFYQVLDYYATDPQPHFQHTLSGHGMRVTHWMPLPEPPKEGAE